MNKLLYDIAWAWRNRSWICPDWYRESCQGILNIPDSCCSFITYGKGFGHNPDAEITLPPWLSEDDVNYYTRKIEKKGFTGGANHYRNINRQISFQFDGELHRFADVIVKKLFDWTWYSDESLNLARNTSYQKRPFTFVFCLLSSSFLPLNLWYCQSCLLYCCRNWELMAPWTGNQIKIPVKFIVGDLDPDI